MKKTKQKQIFFRDGFPYRLTCTTCQEEGNTRKVIAAYEGETGRNGFERGKEHLAKLKKKCEENSVLWLHSLHHHNGRDDIKYTMQVTGVFREPLDRQLTEKIHISKLAGSILMNRKNELGGAVFERERFRYRRLVPRLGRN